MTTARANHADSVIDAILASERRRERIRLGQPGPTPIESKISTMRSDAPEGLDSAVRGHQQTQLSSGERDSRERPAPLDTDTASKTPPLPSGAPVDDVARDHHMTGDD